MANQFVQIEVAVASISTREKFLVFGRTHGAVEIEIDSHADLGRVCVGTRVNVMVGLSDVNALESGNAVAAQFLGVVVAASAAVPPRTSDSRLS
jgi:hypothetical protein